MPVPVTMPRLGLSMIEGTVTEWRVRPGDRVEKGQTLLVIESEKAEVEVEAFEAGTLATIYVERGRTVPVGELLGAIAAPGESFDAGEYAARYVPERSGAPTTTGEPAPRPAAETPGAPPVAATGPKIAPAARALARRLGLAPERITGTGPGGRILPEDVERHAAGLVDAGDARLAAWSAGEGPSVLFVNGFGVDGTGWRRQVDVLSKEHRVITWELRGIGDSAPGREALSITTLAKDAAAVLGHFTAGPAVVVGSSLGAAVALELARREPDAVAALVLLSPVFEPDVRLDAILASWEAIGEPAARAEAMLPWILGRRLLADDGRRPAIAAALRAMATRAPATALRPQREALQVWLADDSRVSGPMPRRARILVGEEDLLTPPAVAEALARHLPDAAVERLPGVGHAPMIEAPDVVNDHIREAASASR